MNVHETLFATFSEYCFCETDVLPRSRVFDPDFRGRQFPYVVPKDPEQIRRMTVLAQEAKELRERFRKVRYVVHLNSKPHNATLQLRRAISIRAVGNHIT